MSNQNITIPGPLNPGDTITITVKTVDPPPPPPPPPPTKTASPSGTTVAKGSTAQIIDTALNTWAFGGPLDARGNVITQNGAPTTSAGVLLLWLNGVLYTQTASGAWWSVVAGVKQAGDPRNPNQPSGGGTVPPPPPPTGVLAAFPGAQGGGAMSAGGRGGKVYEVTNLNDGGPGSLRACLEASGPRIAVFRVAGLISQQKDLAVYNPFLTIAGQTAPGQIILGGPKSNGFTLRISTTDTIARYLTISPDNPNTNPGPDFGSVGYALANGHLNRNIIDHCSLRWASNKSFIAEANFNDEYYADFTMQNCLSYEPHEGHPVAISMSTLSDGGREALCHDMDFVKNMFVNNHHRIPECGPKSMRWINNITFNWGWYALEMLGATMTDVISNVWDYSNLVPDQKYPIHSDPGNTGLDIQGTPSFYIAGNIGPGKTAPNADQIAELTYQITGENGDEVHGHFPANWLRSAPLPASNAFPITVDPAASLLALLAPTVGNSQHLDLNGNWVSHRDAADSRIVKQVQTKGSGGYWPNGVTYTGQSTWPDPLPDWQDAPQTNFTPYPSQHHNGLSDAWVKANGLDTSDPNLHNKVLPSGYTVLDVFLSGGAIPLK